MLPFLLAGMLLCACPGHIFADPDDGSLKWWQKTIAYEIYVKSFKDSDGDGTGDIPGITSELDHLQNLGVGAVWLTPCYVSPQADNGYDIADYYNIDPAYGTMEDMENLIAEAKKRDIRIVMDLVFNHTSIENEWFNESRSGRDNDKSDWYIWRDPKPDGSAPTNWRSIFGGSAWTFDETRGQYYLHTFLPEQPDLNWANPEVRRALIDVAGFWVEKGVGGFRMDAVTYIRKPDVFLDGTPDAADRTVSVHTMTANTEGILDYLHEFKAEVLDGTDLFTVGEANGVSADELPEWVGADGVFDMIFEFDHVSIDLPDEMNWCKTREWKLPEFKSCFSNSEAITESTGGWYPVFLENHDLPRSVSHFLAKDADRVSGAKALAALLLTMRGTPFIMEGEELGYINVCWDRIEDYQDISTRNHYQFALDEGYSEEEAMEGVHRFARDSARTPMQWNDSENAGFTTGTPWLPVYNDYEQYNVDSEMADADSVLNWYITLSRLRSEHEELVAGDYKELMPENEQIFAYSREAGGKKAVILINLTAQEAVYDASCVEGAGLLLSSNGNSVKGKLAPFEAVIYQVERETALLKDCPLYHKDNGSGVYLNISIDDFNGLGFDLGDTLDLAFSNGYVMEEIPYFSGYYSEAYQPLLIAYPGHEEAKATFNYGEDLWTVAGLKEGDTVSVGIHEKGGRLEEQRANDIHYTNERSDYESDEVFANFREVTAGDIRKGRMYRSASPCDNKYGRASFVDALASKAGISCIVDLADDDEDIAGFFAAEDYDSPFFREMYENGAVLPLSLSMNYLDENFQKSLAEGLTAMSQKEGPFLIHCLEGKDRTGFVCMLLEALYGASYQEILDDYMLTYDNYYRISKESDPARYDTIKELNIDPMLKAIVSDESVDISTADLSRYARDYMLRIGMDRQAIERLSQCL